MVEPSDIKLGQWYWVDRGRFKRYCRLMNIYPRLKKWLPMKVQIESLPIEVEFSDEHYLDVRWIYESNKPSNFIHQIPLNTLVREYKSFG